jgi:hypothetical protein
LIPGRAFLDDEKSLLDEVIRRRGSALERTTSFTHWTQQPETVVMLVGGSVEWAELPVELGDVHNSVIGQLALHSILLPAGVVEWSADRVGSTPIKMLPLLLGGLRVDVRGSQAPRPAAHRLFVPKEEAENFRQQYLHATLLHGLDLVVQNGRSFDWRRWFGEIVSAVIEAGLTRSAFVNLYGQTLEDNCGFGLTENGKTFYLSRAEILLSVPGRIYLTHAKDLRVPSLRWEDGVNRLFADMELGRHESVEVDLSRPLIVRAKK